VQIDSIFKKIKDTLPPFSLPLFRGIQIKKELKPNKIGSNITFSDYLSTSINPGIAFKYQNCGKQPCCILVLHINDKVPYIPLYKNNTSLYKHEVLLPRNTSWKIIKKYKTSIDYNQAATCPYDDIKKTIKRKITVYELKAIPYKYPDDLLEELNYQKYKDLRQKNEVQKNGITKVTLNNGFFKVTNKLPLLVKKPA